MYSFAQVLQKALSGRRRQQCCITMWILSAAVFVRISTQLLVSVREVSVNLTSLRFRSDCGHRYKNKTAGILQHIAYSNLCCHSNTDSPPLSIVKSLHFTPFAHTVSKEIGNASRCQPRPNQRLEGQRPGVPKSQDEIDTWLTGLTRWTRAQPFPPFPAGCVYFSSLEAS